MNERRMKRRMFGLGICLFLSATLMAQTDVFGNRIPAKKTMVEVSLPDKPNHTDANGLKQGEWAKKYENGRYRYQATFIDDQPVGKMVRYSEEGKKTAEILYDQTGKGRARLFDESERLVAQGNYIHNQRDSIWLFYNVKGEIRLREPYFQGKVHGVSLVYFPDGSVAEEATSENGILNGAWRTFYRGGMINLRGQYVNGLLHGKYEAFTPEGLLEQEGNYKQGKQDGDWKIYQSDTKNYLIFKYRDGVLLNAGEIDQIMFEKMQRLEQQRGNLKDPERYRNDPQGYLRN